MTSPTTADKGRSDAQPKPADESFAIGAVLDRKYRIDSAIAEGGMGLVLRATHLELDCVVAIKLIHPDHAANEDVIARLLAEARIAAGLRSKHVNRVLDIGRTPSGLPYLVLEYMRGCDLGEYAERRCALPVAEAADLLMQACEGLAEAHAVGVVHRDLKPENLFLCEDADGGFVLKVLDFGISKAPAARRGARRLTNPFEIVGSPTYMAPEQILGAQVDARADIWALGAVLYELCTGDILFDGLSKTEIFARILTEQQLPPPLAVGRNSAELRRVIGKCLARDVEERYQDVVELAAALAQFGTDDHQAERVAKVASASRARAIAKVGAMSLDVALATPVALTTTRVEDEIQEDEVEEGDVRRRRGRPWPWVLGAAATFSLIGAWHAVHLRAPAVAMTTLAVASATAQQPETAALSREPTATPILSPEPVPRIPAELPAAVAPSASAASPSAVIAAATVEHRAWTPRVPAATRAVAWRAPQPPAALPPPMRAENDVPAPAAAPPVAPSDAWDPKNFGGRR